MAHEHPLERAKRLAAASRPSPRARRVPPAHTDQEVQLARLIRSTYIRARSMWESMHYGTETDYQPRRQDDAGGVWFALADLLSYSGRAAGVDPVDYVHTAFERGVNRRPPTPKDLLSDRYLREYLAAADSRRASDQYRHRFNAERVNAAAHISFLQQYGKQNFAHAHADTLEDEELELSALFRFCLARQLLDGVDPDGADAELYLRVARRYEMAAAFQYRRNPAEYRRVMGGLIPDDFIARVDALFRFGMDREDDWDGQEKES